jgi:catechol 2,3-dioxygenase-like lactoylglutathione lyase family enzyme
VLDLAPVEPVDAAVLHPNGTRAIDHVVVATPDLDRTVAALEAAGLEARRVRDAGRGDQAMRQVFFRLGDPILEVVGPPEPSGDGPARFFGLALTVADLDATAAALGPHLGEVKDAVQPGRRIATLRRSAGCTTALAFMNPPPPR